MDNKFFTFMNKVADLCILNIICLVCCIPIVTAGASITAMYYVTLKMVRNEEAYIVRSFFKSFKDNFKQATIINLIMIAVGAILYLDLNVAKNMPGSAGQIFHVIFMAFVIIYYVLFLYVYPDSGICRAWWNRKLKRFYDRNDHSLCTSGTSPWICKLPYADLCDCPDRYDAL